MILSSIAAMAKNRVIGKDNKLPWNVPEDFKFFRQKTKGSILIMGRKTFESLPEPLPHRFHIVITRNQSYDVHHPMVEVVSSLAQAFELAHMLLAKFPQRFSEEVFIAGGEQIYREAMPQIHRLYLTIIDQTVEGDAFFPGV